MKEVSSYFEMIFEKHKKNFGEHNLSNFWRKFQKKRLFFREKNISEMSKEQGILRGLFEYLPFQYELFCLLLNSNLFFLFHLLVILFF